MTRRQAHGPGTPRAATWLLALALAFVLAGPVPDALAGDPVGFSGSIGYGGAGGDFGPYLDSGWTADFNVFGEFGSFRAGIGAEFSGYGSTPGGAFEKWSVNPVYGFFGWTPRREAGIRPYVLARFGPLRMRPFVAPERTGSAVNGWSVSLVPGVEVPLRRSLSLDLSLALTRNAFEATAFEGPGSAAVSSGMTWSARAGLTWRGGGRPEPKSTFAPEPPGPWTVTPDYGLAVGELLFVLTAGSVYNEYGRDARWAQFNPETWWNNLERGFNFDGNKFDTNHLHHPWSGGIYYSTGRSNGLGFWSSAALTTGGSLLWECCGEVQQMSFNDMVTTAFGGVAVGEAMHRLGSVILDNRDTGATRVLREAGIWVIDPVRGFNRLAFRSRLRSPNPEEPYDWRPPQLGALIAVGARRVDPDADVEGDVVTGGVADLTVRFGDVISNERRRPFDSFELRFQVNFTDRLEPVGAMVIRGDLASWSLGDSGRGAFAFTQHFDYLNNREFEFGTQSLGLSMAYRVPFSDTVRLDLRGDVLGTVQGAVQPDLRPVDEDTPLPSGRRHDYGPGLGFYAVARLVARQAPILEAYYRYQWIHVINDTAIIGGGADHRVRLLGGRLQVPLFSGLGLGVEGETWTQSSSFDGGFLDADRRLTQLRAYVTWQLGGF